MSTFCIFGELMKQLLITILLLCFGFRSEAQIWLHPNKGQWDERVVHKVELQKGELLLEKDQITYHFFDFDLHENKADHYNGHVIKQRFLNATGNPEIVASNPSDFYRNYYLGNDPNKWSAKVFSFKQTTYRDFLPNIDLIIDGSGDQIKYNWVIKPGADIRQLSWNYDGATGVELENGQLKVSHSLGSFTETKPVSWIIRSGTKIPLKSAFKVDNGNVSFELQGIFNSSDTIVIDPSLTFSTFTGSVSDNWGFTATPDGNGNLIAGGIVFGSNYPVSPGAYDGSYNGGGGGTYQIDVGLTKFNASGTALVFSTFIGGNKNETPHSVISDANGDIYLFGATASPNFPMAGTSYDNSHNGGPTTIGNSIQFDGSDLYIVRLNAAGTALIASTYVGGSGTDGVNDGSLYYNYGDQFRGEINLDGNFVYVSSTSKSSDFPVLGAGQASNMGGTDAVVFKINKTLSALSWSSYYGSSTDDSGNGVEIMSNGDVFLTGGTTGTLNFGSGGFQNSFSGNRDGYIVRMNGLNGAVTNGTYMGTSSYDQSYFIQLDSDESVLIFGQSDGTFTATPGVYTNPNAGQFIAKYSNTLATQNWITKIGASSGHVGISPTAFLVSNCNDIYVSGWGGFINQQFAPGATLSSTNGFPVTSDAYQSTTNGSNFWIAVLDQDAAALKYATFFGGAASSYNHVDGGTSRFDKNGSIYHAVCGACGGNPNGFTTTPGAWSTVNPSSNCNLAAWKFELSTIEAVVADPAPIICLPAPVVFQNNSANGNAFYWNFGDGTTSTAVNPSHLYSSAGTYTVSLLVVDTNQCYGPDSVEFIVNIGDFNGGVVQPNIAVCPGQSAQLEAYGGTSYTWSPAALLNNPSISNPIATISATTLFTCIISDSCGIDTVTVLVTLNGGSVSISNDTTICIGNSVPLFVSGVPNATWSPATYLDNPNSLNPLCTPLNSITYTVSGVSTDGCTLNEQVTVNVEFNPPNPQLIDTLKYCFGGSGTITASGATDYIWSPNSNISTTIGPTVTISSLTEQYYYCLFINACASKMDSVFISLVTPSISAGNDTIVCPGEPATFWAIGGISYTWTPNVNPLESDFSLVEATANDTTIFVVTGTDQFGCVDTDSVYYFTYPKAFIQTQGTVYAIFGEPVQLSATATTSGIFVWSPSEYLDCITCSNPLASPDQNFTYTVSYTDENGCSASDDVQIKYDPIIYVPNTFTPNDGDMFNSEFFAIGANISDFKMEIYNRWGELIYEGNELSQTWDGTYRGKNCPDGVYTWKIVYKSMFNDEKFLITGHVSLLR